MKITILGAGTWGIALARMLTVSGHEVTVWSAIEKEITDLAATHRHPHLPDVEIPADIFLTTDIESACAGCKILLFAVPSVFVRSTAKNALSSIPDHITIVDVAKGIEPGTHLYMSQILEEVLHSDGRHEHVSVVALSGPTHAEEVARDLPTTIVAASSDAEAARLVQDTFSNNCMRVYTNGDVHGVELCGALKNVIALAAGVSKGLGFGDNTKAALITRGMSEIMRLGVRMGYEESTFYGLAGIGDLIVTCTSVHSRNNRAGELIGSGMSAEEATQAVGMVVEGLNALPAAMELSCKYGVELPICSAVDRIVKGIETPKDSVRSLMMREYKAE